MFKGLFRVLCPALLVILGTSVVAAQAQTSDDGIVYEDHNQVDPKPLKMQIVFGRASLESGFLVPKVKLGIFTENDHLLVATAETDQEGKFRFARIPPGRY